MQTMDQRGHCRFVGKGSEMARFKHISQFANCGARRSPWPLPPEVHSLQTVNIVV